MNWKQLAKAVVDEVKKWAEERFADVEKVKLLAAAEVRDLSDVVARTKAKLDELDKALRELKAAPPPTVKLDGVAGMVTAAVDAWFKANPPPIPKDGTSVDVEDLQPFLQAALAKWQLEFERHASGVFSRWLEQLPKPQNGKDADPAAIRAAVDAFMVEHPLPELDAEAITRGVLELASAKVAAYLDEHPAKPDPEKLAEAIGAAVSEYVRANPPPARGPTPEELAPLVAEYLKANPPARGPGPTAESVEAAVAKHLEKHPPAAGRAPTSEEIAAAVAKHLELHPIPTPKDGRTPTGAELDEAVASYLKAHPPAAGQDASPEQIAAAVAVYLKANPPPPGKPGESVTLETIRGELEKHVAKWALDFERGAAGFLERAVERMPKPADGKDGLRVTDLGLELDEDGRTLRFVLADGEQRHVATIRAPWPLDRGVFKDGAEYVRGDSVTFGGSSWIAQKDAPLGRPGASADWRLAVKHGRDAKK